MIRPIAWRTDQLCGGSLFTFYTLQSLYTHVHVHNATMYGSRSLPGSLAERSPYECFSHIDAPLVLTTINIKDVVSHTQHVVSSANGPRLSREVTRHTPPRARAERNRDHTPSVQLDHLLLEVTSYFSK